MANVGVHLYSISTVSDLQVLYSVILHAKTISRASLRALTYFFQAFDCSSCSVWYSPVDSSASGSD